MTNTDSALLDLLATGAATRLVTLDRRGTIVSVKTSGETDGGRSTLDWLGQSYIAHVLDRTGSDQRASGRNGAATDVERVAVAEIERLRCVVREGGTTTIGPDLQIEVCQRSDDDGNHRGSVVIERQATGADEEPDALDATA